MDIYGRLTLAEMRNEVRRRCDLLRYNINAAGSETGLQQVNLLVSDQDLNMYLNMALARRCVDVNIQDNTIMADEQLIDIAADTVEYELPPDLMLLRAVYFKPFGVAASQMPPSQRYLMTEVDSFEDINQQPSADVIYSYRRRLNLIVLNQVPESNNPEGLLVDYVKMMLPLLDDAQILETPLAWLLQQVIIQDSVVEVVAQKMKLDTTELRQTQAELVEQLGLAVLNYHIPKTIKLAGAVNMVYPPFARRPSSWQSLGSGGWGWW